MNDEKMQRLLVLGLSRMVEDLETIVDAMELRLAKLENQPQPYESPWSTPYGGGAYKGVTTMVTNKRLTEMADQQSTGMETL